MTFEVVLRCKETVDVFDLEKQLYNSVFSGALDIALKVTDQLHSVGHTNVINNVITRLLDDKIDIILNYAYKLWFTNYQDIVIGYFPTAFKLLLNGDNVKITNKQYGLPIKLQSEVDGDNDRQAWGHGRDKLNNNRMMWTFSTIWENNTLYFKIFNSEYMQYLKLEIKKDGDRLAFGSINSSTDRHQWYLCPVMQEGELLFYIVNREYERSLELSKYECMKDRQVYGHYGIIQGKLQFG